MVFYIFDISLLLISILWKFLLSFTHRNPGNSQIMGKKKRASHWQNPKPSERTSADQNFAHTVKTLFRLIQCIHYFSIANNQLNGTVSKTLRLNLKLACLTASLAQQIELNNSRWPQEVTECLVSQFRERIDAFKRQLSTFRLNVLD